MFISALASQYCADEYITTETVPYVYRPCISSKSSIWLDGGQIWNTGNIYEDKIKDDGTVILWGGSWALEQWSEI